MQDLSISARPEELQAIVRLLARDRTLLASPEDVYFCFRLLLGRDPSPEEAPGHLRAAVGRELAEVVGQFLNSEEFSNRKLLQRRDDNARLFEIQSFKMYADTEDQAVGHDIPTGIYERHVTELFRREILPGQVVVDIGANIGYFSLLASSIVGASGQVIAVEPSTANCRLIEASRRANGFGQLRVHSVAAAQQNGMLALHSVYTNGSVGDASDDLATLMRSSLVEGVRLDCLLDLVALDFVKIDVEGFEHFALQGFENHLGRFKPKVVSEFTPSAMTDPAAYLQFLFGLGYKIGIVNVDGVDYPEQVPSAIIERQARSGYAHVDIFGTPAA